MNYKHFAVMIFFPSFSPLLHFIFPTLFSRVSWKAIVTKAFTGPWGRMEIVMRRGMIKVYEIEAIKRFFLVPCVKKTSKTFARETQKEKAQKKEKSKFPSLRLVNGSGILTKSKPRRGRNNEFFFSVDIPLADICFLFIFKQLCPNYIFLIANLFPLLHRRWWCNMFAGSASR